MYKYHFIDFLTILLHLLFYINSELKVKTIIWDLCQIPGENFHMIPYHKYLVQYLDFFDVLNYPELMNSIKLIKHGI